MHGYCCILGFWEAAARNVVLKEVFICGSQRTEILSPVEVLPTRMKQCNKFSLPLPPQCLLCEGEEESENHTTT